MSEKIKKYRRYEKELSTLDSTKRLNILYLLNDKEEGMRFKNIQERTRYKTSELVFDLTVLKNNNYLTSSDSKNFSITNKGKNVLNLLEETGDKFSKFSEDLEDLI